MIQTNSMQEDSIGARHKAYEDAYDLTIIKRLPVIIRVDGRGFSKLTKKIQKPFCSKMMGLMASTMLSSAKEIDGCIFAYQQSDEISFILRNDQSLQSEPWFGNRIQKIGSITAALATYEFNSLLSIVPDKPDLTGRALFDAMVFAVPTLGEAINNIVFRQQDCIRNATTNAAQAELGRKLGRKTAMKLLHGKNHAARVKLLEDNCSINFDLYPAAFRYGIAAYKVPKIFDTDEGPITRQKWTLDTNIPIFAKNRSFIVNILNSGRDIFRAERDLKDEG